MKTIVAVLFILASSPHSQAQEASGCSEENLHLIFEKTATLVGNNGYFEGQLAKVFINPDYAKSNLEDIKKQYNKIKKDHYDQTSKVLADLDTLLKKYPACDRKHILTSKK